MQGYKMDKADRTLRAVMTHVESKRREREREWGKKKRREYPDRARTHDFSNDHGKR